jgi:ubiquinone biosynthesis protein Coq4
MQEDTLNLNLSQKLNHLKGNFYFLRFIRNPYDTEGIFKMAKSFHQSAPKELVQKVIGPLLEKSSIESDFHNRVWHAHPKMAELAHYPEGSFGREAYLFFTANNLDENLFPAADYTDVASYITSRVYQAHDFWHVLTGHSVDLIDEMALQAFSVGQFKQALGMTIIAGGIIHIMQKHPDRAFEIMNAITEGYERGLKARLLLDINIFQYLDRPLKEVQEELGIVPRTKFSECA